MNIFLYICVIFFVFYIVDKTICFVYSFAKKKRIHEKKDLRNQYNANQNKSGFIWRIKQLLYGWIMYSVNRLGNVPFQRYRLFVLKYIYLMEIADNVVLYHGFDIRAPWNIRIGKGTVIGEGAFLDGRNGLIIGDNVNISTGVYIFTEQHDINDPYFESGDSGGMVIVGNRAWLSSRSTVLPNVTVGEGAVLASGGLATKDLDPFCLYGGIPAKKIGERSRHLQYDFNGNYIPFF